MRNLKLTVRYKISGTFKQASLTFKKGYQPRTNIVKDEKGEMVAGCHSILARWRNHFSQLISVHGVSNVGRQKYMSQNH